MSKRILIVEDNMIIRMDLEDSLHDAGLEVIASTAFGEQAIEIAASAAIDVILMDIGLKGTLDGLETGAMIKERFGIPFILLSGNSDPTTNERAQLLKPHAFLIKPIHMDELIGLIRNLP